MNMIKKYENEVIKRIKLISKVDKICDVSPSSFSPAPKVYSSIVVFQPLHKNLRLNMELEKYIDKLLKVAFNGRRKKLKNTLSTIFSKDEFKDLEDISKVDFDKRPQDISVKSWIRIAKHCTNIEKSR